jgi:arylsulfatase A-like enzyme
MTRPNVLFLVMDTARAQSALPAENPGVMPNLESFQKGAATFSDAITSAPWTLPSHASMFTGQYTTDHGTNAGSLMFEPEVTPLAEQLRQSGYETMAVSNNTWISPQFGFDVGFDHFYCGWELLKGGVDLQEIVRENYSRIQQLKSIVDELTLNNIHRTILNTAYAWGYHRRYDYGAKFTNYRIKRLLSKTWDQSRPFFMFVNYLEPHLTYDPPKPYRYEHVPDDLSREQLESAPQEQWEYLAGGVDMDEDDFRALEALYEGELSYLDYRLGQLFDFLRSEGILDETLVFVVGDHGENIGDHGLMDHQYCLNDTLLRVPLIVRHPEMVPSGWKTDALVELRDLYPTILDLCDVDVSLDESVSSFSLGEDGYIDETTIGDREFVFAEYTVPQPDLDELRSRTDDEEALAFLDSLDRSLRCLRTGDWKFVRSHDGSVELFDLNSDPGETNNIAENHSELVTDFGERLDTKFDSLKPSTGARLENVGEGTRDRLKDLGYI